MWSVGRKCGRLYMGSRVALLQLAGYSLVTLEFPPTLPLSAMLQQLAVKSQQQGIDLSTAKLDIDLSASLCKGVVISSSWNSSDLRDLPPKIRDEFSRQLPWPPEQWVWPSGAMTAGLLPVTTQGFMKNLIAWAADQKIILGVVQPLWALVTQSKRAASDAINSIALAEPEGAVVFSVGDDSQFKGQQASWHFASSNLSADSTSVLRDLMLAQQMNQSKVAVFQFHAKADFGEELGLKAWDGHWGQV